MKTNNEKLRYHAAMYLTLFRRSCRNDSPRIGDITVLYDKLFTLNSCGLISYDCLKRCTHLRNEVINKLQKLNKPDDRYLTSDEWNRRFYDLVRTSKNGKEISIGRNNDGKFVVMLWEDLHEVIDLACFSNIIQTYYFTKGYLAAKPKIGFSYV